MDACTLVRITKERIKRMIIGIGKSTIAKKSNEYIDGGIPFIEINDPDHYDLEELVLRMKGATAA